MKLTQISTGDWVPIEEIYAITVSPDEARVKLSFKNTLIYYIICTTHKVAEELRDEIAELVNPEPTVSVYVEKPLAERLIEKPEILEELKRRLYSKDIVK